MPIKHGRAASVKSALTFSRRKTTSLLAIYVDEAGRRLYPRVCCFLLMSIPGAQQPCSGLTSGKGRGEWSKPCLTASGNRRLLCPLGASFCTSVGRHGESSVVVSSLHAAMSSVVTAAQTSAWVQTWLPRPSAACPETLAFLEACAAHQLLLSTKVCRGASMVRMPLPPLPILKMIDSEWDAVSPPIIKASSESCSGRVSAAGLPGFLCGVLSSTWAVAMLR